MPANKTARLKLSLASLIGALLVAVLLLGPATGAPGPDSPDTERHVPSCAHAEAVPLIDTELPEPTPTGGGLPVHEECPGIRPGARMGYPVGCTYNFVFEDADHLYIGTAGHCVGFVGQRVSAASNGQFFGTVVYRLNSGVGADFALIQIDEDKRDEVDPNMCMWHGAWSAEPVTWSGQPMHHYGWGTLTMHSPSERARTGELTETSTTHVRFESFVSGGDSGSPATTVTGQALGLITHGSGGSYQTGFPVGLGTHIDHAIGLAHGAGFDISLVPAVADVPSSLQP